MPESHNIWVQYINSDLHNTFQACVPSFPALYFCCTPPIQIPQFQKHLPTEKMISTFSKRSKNPEQRLLHPQAQQCVAVITTQYKDPHGWAECIDGFFQVLKQPKKLNVVTVGAIVGPAHAVRETAASDRIGRIWLVNNHVDLDSCCTAY